MEQPLQLLEYMDHVHGRVVYWQQKRREEEQGEVMKEQMKRNI